jgi:hypothetical protein
LAEIVSLTEATSQKVVGAAVNVIPRLLITGANASNSVLQQSHISAQQSFAFTSWATQTHSPQLTVRIFSLDQKSL